MEVEELEPKTPALYETIKSMNDRGIRTLYGRWLIDGAPRVLLFDTGTAYSFLDQWKGDLWSTAGIPSPPNDHETNEAIVFGYLIAWFLGEVIASMQRYPNSSVFDVSNTSNTVCLSRNETRCHRTIPRMAGGSCYPFVPETQD